MKYEIKEILKTGSEKFGEYIFEKVDGKYIGHTYSEFYTDILKTAAALQKTHTKEDKIIIYASNSYNYMVLDAAIMGYTCISVTISKEWSSQDLMEAMKLVEPKMVVYSRDKKDEIERVKEKYSDTKYLPIEGIVPDVAGEVEYDRMEIDDVCKIIFSSGTTGLPKGVMLTQRKMFASYDCLQRRAPMGKGDIDYLFLPLNHTYANIWNFWNSAICGMQLYLCSDTSKMFEEILEARPSIFCAVPLIFQRLFSYCLDNEIDPKKALGGNIKYLFCGGAVLEPKIREFFKKNGLKMLEAYGLTETSSIISLEYVNNDDFTSVGAVMENMDAKIFDPDEGGIGEILVRGEAVFDAYFKNPIKVFDEDGFFHTGDLGRIQDGKLYFEGRKKRVIVYPNGENIYPEDIEKLFMDQNIRKVKVFDRLGKLTAKLYVEKEKDYTDYIQEINNKLPKFSRILDFDVVIDDIEKRMK